MRNHWSIFSTIQNCEVTELNLKKSFLKRLITTPYFSSSIDSCISSRWISIEFVLITIPRTSSTRYVGTRGVPRISNVTLPILLFPPFQLAGHYTGPDIQSRRISFRNTIKGRKRESRPTVEPTSSVCIDDPVAAAATTTTTTIYACVYVCIHVERTGRGAFAALLSRKGGGGRGRREGSWTRPSFLDPLNFRPAPLVGGGREQQMTPADSATRRIVIWFLATPPRSLAYPRFAAYMIVYVTR